MTDKEKHRFYKSAAWQAERIKILRRVTNANREGRTLAGDDRIIARATQVHHIIHLEDAPELGLDDDNLEAVCIRCHNLLHGRTPERLNCKRHGKPISREQW